MKMSEGVEWTAHACALLAALPPGMGLPAAALAEFHYLAPAYMAKHMQALARANKVRLARAELKRAIARGDADVAEVITENPWEADSMSLSELLVSQRRWGRTRSRKFLAHLALTENKKVGSLTTRQRLMLANELQARSDGREPAYV